MRAHPGVRDAGDLPGGVAHGPDHRAGHQVPAARGQRDRAGRGDPGLGAARLMPPLPQVEGGRCVRGEPAAPGLHRADPVGPGQAARGQAGRDRGGGDHRGGAGVRPGGAAMPHGQPGEVRRGGHLGRRAGGHGRGRQPHRQHRHAVQRGPVEPARRPARPPGEHGAAAGHQRDRRGCDDHRHGQQDPEHAHQVPDHGVPPGGTSAAPGGRWRISIRAAGAPSASLARATAGRAAGAHR